MFSILLPALPSAQAALPLHDLDFAVMSYMHTVKSA